MSDDNIHELYTGTAQQSRDQVQAVYGKLAFITKTPVEPRAAARCGDTLTVESIGTFTCTRSKDHTGMHEAHYAKGVAARMWINTATWDQDAALDVQTWRAKGYGTSQLAQFPNLYYKNFPDQQYCGATGGAYSCTLVKGHAGLHEALVSVYTAVIPPFEKKESPFSYGYKASIATPAAKTPVKYEKYPYPYKPAKYEHADAGHQCAEPAPDGSYVCSRPKGHDGLHEPMTYIEQGKWLACGETWGTPEPVAWAPNEPEGLIVAVQDADFQPYIDWAKNPKVPYFDHAHDGAYCGVSVSNNSYECTREEGHSGPHEAHYVYTEKHHIPCGPPWWSAEEEHA